MILYFKLNLFLQKILIMGCNKNLFIKKNKQINRINIKVSNNNNKNNSNRI